VESAKCLACTLKLLRVEDKAHCISFGHCPYSLCVSSSSQKSVLQLFHTFFIWVFLGATTGAGTTYSSGAPEFTPVFSGFCVTRSVEFL